MIHHLQEAPLGARITCYSHSDFPVLIVGETGVGKELAALSVHEQSDRKRGPFIPINCAGFPPTLFESELFGHERGAFSGALQNHLGLIRKATGGTLFLDEIGELDLSLQVKLLRTLETHEVRAVGSTRIEHINTRFIAATNADLPQLVARGTFRQDLFERLSVLRIEVPPLRERKEEIERIAREILGELSCTASPEALVLLHSYDWPGNIRQLKNVLIRCSVLGQRSIRSDLLASVLEEEKARHPQISQSHGGVSGTLAEIEREAIVRKLTECRGNRKRAAKELGIAKSTLHEKIRRWKEESEEPLDWPLGRVPRDVAESDHGRYATHFVDV